MYEEKDVYIKDEGDFATVCFLTKKSQDAIKAEKKEITDQLREGMGSATNVVKLDIEIDSIDGIIQWCASHDLTCENEF